MKKRLFCLFLAVIMTLTGCESTVSELTLNEDLKTKAQEKEEIEKDTYKVEQPVLLGEITSELPVSTVRVMVNRYGYQIGREKKVIFQGENLTNNFRVIRESDWEVVHTGMIQEISVKEDLYDCVISIGDFSAITEPGRYYIEQNDVGRSYTFEIVENVFEPIFQGMLENALAELPQKDSVSSEDICDVSFGMHSMMLALQCHGALFEEDNNLVMKLLETAEWLMNFQDESTGSMFDDYEATAAFCGVLAQSADTFGKYDVKVSKEYMAASKKAWRWLERQSQQAKEYPSANFYAAAQLFKTEGTRNYVPIIEKYLSTRKEKITEDRFGFYGSVIYLNTIKNTDRDLCTQIMQELVNETEEISSKTKKNPYLVYTSDINENLQKVLLICFMDYITPSNEYAVIIENTLHYLCGRNETGDFYLEQEGIWYSCEATEDRTLEWNGILLFCLSDLLNVEADDVE